MVPNLEHLAIAVHGTVTPAIVRDCLPKHLITLTLFSRTSGSVWEVAPELSHLRVCVLVKPYQRYMRTQSSLPKKSLIPQMQRACCSAEMLDADDA